MTVAVEVAAFTRRAIERQKDSRRRKSGRNQWLLAKANDWGGGTATPAGADSDADAGAKAREAALKRMEAPPQGFSAAGTHKMKNAK